MSETTEPTFETTLRLPFEVDLRLVLGPLWHGPRDPSMRLGHLGFARAAHTPGGPATVSVTRRGSGEFGVQAWGAGAAIAVDGLADLLGAADEPAALVPHHRLIGELVRRLPGLRMTRSRAAFEALLFAIVGQRVTGLESSNSHRSVVRRYGQPAPGPLALTLPPTPAELARQPYWAFHGLGIERRRADVIRHAAAAAPAFERALKSGAEVTRQRLTSIHGIGPWTAAETIRLALGDPDAVSFGDYHVPNLVSWALSGEARGSDERMLELLEPYEGQRARVVLLLELSGLQPPRFGPRMAPRSIAAI